MKHLIFIITLIMTTQSFAAKCILTAQVNEGSSCSKISTRLDVSDLSACAEFAKSTRKNQFFGLVEKDQSLISTGYSYKDRSGEPKTEVLIVHDDEARCD